MGVLSRLIRSRRRRAEPPPRSLSEEEEEYEIAEMERAARADRRRFGENLIKKFGHSRWPFNEDPFDRS
jgi:hypothetical protein